MCHLQLNDQLIFVPVKVATNPVNQIQKQYSLYEITRFNLNSPVPRLLRANIEKHICDFGANMFVVEAFLLRVV